MSLKISPDQKKKLAQQGKAAEVIAESWEDVSSSDTEMETDADNVSRKYAFKFDQDVLRETPGPPPPTPISMRSDESENSACEGRQLPASAKGSRGEEKKRPEKTTAVAGRLIAGALGLKAPKKTDEQRAYDRATKEQEIKRKTREKAMKDKEREEDEKARAAAWGS